MVAMGKQEQKEVAVKVMEDDSIDLVALLSQIWKGRKRILLVSMFFALMGLVVALITPNTYEASSVFITQTSGDKPSSSLGGLASLAGINLGDLGSSSGISPTLYPKILYSVPFKRAMLRATVIDEDNKMTYGDYLRNQPLSSLDKVKKYTTGLPGIVLSWFKEEEAEVVLEQDVSNNLPISSKEYGLLNSLDGRVNLSINEKEGFITLSVIDRKPEITAQVVAWAEQALQERILAYQVNKTKALFDFTEEQFLEKQQELFKLEDELAQFNEQNQNINSAFVQNQLRRLETEYNRLNAVYTELAQQKEQAALQLEKDTPIFSIIDPVVLPNEKASPKRALIIIIWSFLGFVLSIGSVLVKDPLMSILSEIKN